MRVVAGKPSSSAHASLVEFAETTDLNRIEMRDSSIGIIASGAVYQHVRDALPQARHIQARPFLALPPAKLKEFADAVEHLYVVEEACDYFAEHVRALGIAIEQPPAGPLPEAGEPTPASSSAPLASSFPRRSLPCGPAAASSLAMRGVSASPRLHRVA